MVVRSSGHGMVWYNHGMVVALGSQLCLLGSSVRELWYAMLC